MAFIIDSYPETNPQAAGIFLLSNSVGQADMGGQVFYNEIADTVDYCTFYLKKVNGPAGNCYAKIYAITGTPGTNAKPTGAVLATSDAVDMGSLSTSSTLQNFTFSTRVSLAADTWYAVVIDVNAGSFGAGIFLDVGCGVSASTHAGNRCYSADAGSTWTGVATYDVDFYVYGLGLETAKADYVVSYKTINITRIFKIIASVGAFILSGAAQLFRIDKWSENDDVGSSAFTNDAIGSSAFTNDSSGSGSWTNDTKP